jgi:hypothetical protein
MTLKLVAKLDKKGSEASHYTHYIFGKPGSPVNGGVYIEKSMPNPPDFLELEFKQEKE